MKIHLWLWSLLTLLLSVDIQAQIGSFRFAQLTDIHLNETNPKPTEDLLRSIAQINATDSLDFVPVSYTHLDVYKRQVVVISLGLSYLATPYPVVEVNSFEPARE